MTEEECDSLARFGLSCIAKLENVYRYRMKCNEAVISDLASLAGLALFRCLRRVDMDRQPKVYIRRAMKKEFWYRYLNCRGHFNRLESKTVPLDALLDMPSPFPSPPTIAMFREEMAMRDAKSAEIPPPQSAPLRSEYQRVQVGDIFGDWRVEESRGRNRRKDCLWLCICTCGKSRVKTASSLKRNSKTHCGCKSYRRRHTYCGQSSAG